MTPEKENKIRELVRKREVAFECFQSHKQMNVPQKYEDRVKAMEDYKIAEYKLWEAEIEVDKEMKSFE